MAVDILYWNIGSKKRSAVGPLVTEHIARHMPSIIALSEPPSVAPATLESSISQAIGSPVQHVSALNPSRDLVFVRRDSGLTVTGFRAAHDGRVGFYKVGDGGNEMLLVVLHLIDAMNHSAIARHGEARRVSETIRQVEQDLGHRRTLVMGDFNMNPYDTGMTAADGFNAVADVQVAAGDRRYAGESFPFFYNPSWGLLGLDVAN